MEHSDFMLCNSYAALVYDHKRANDEVFTNIICRDRPVCVRDIDKESRLWMETKNSRVKTCTDDIMNRGGNATFPTAHINAGFSAWPDVNANDFLLNPCRENTWKNHLHADDEKLCSIKHQMFMNITKRR